MLGAYQQQQQFKIKSELRPAAALRSASAQAQHFVCTVASHNRAGLWLQKRVRTLRYP